MAYFESEVFKLKEDKDLDFFKDKFKKINIEKDLRSSLTCLISSFSTKHTYFYSEADFFSVFIIKREKPKKKSLSKDKQKHMQDT